MLTERKRARWLMKDAVEAANGRGLLDRMMAQRGHGDAAAVDRFLSPKLTDLDDPAQLPGCVAAAKRLARAVSEQQPVVVYGDYDVDGVTASSILWHTLRKLGHKAVTTYVPHRLEEGYGVNVQALNGFAEMDPKPLVITVDCGITAVDAAKHAQSLGLELIVTDHHQFDVDDLPEAVALVHPELPSESSEKAGALASPLCGAGVAFKVAWQTARTFYNTMRLPQEVQGLLLDLLAYAALGTVADVVPLTGENRVIVVHGLSRIKDTRFDGLNAMIDAAELRAQKVDAYHVGFVIGPRLNACGRMGHARQAVTLLTDASPVQARELAAFLTQENELRRQTEREMVEQAIEMVEAEGHDADDRRVLVLAKEGWHPGVVGIVASRLAERYHRPAVVLGIDLERGVAKGSARSVTGLDLHAAISVCAEHCDKFGGHAMAAGMTLKPEAIEGFREALVAEVNRHLEADDLVPTFRLDADVTLEDCTAGLFATLERMGPFGCANPAPRLRLCGVVVARAAQRMGREGKHMSVALRGLKGGAIRAVGFGLGDLVDALPAGVSVDVIFKPSLNHWRGVTSPELHVLDIRLA